MDLSNKYLKAWLTFNKSPTDDAKLNNWTTFGNPTIGTENAFNGNALQLDGQSYLKLSGVQFGGRNFCIDGWVYVDSSSPANARIITVVNPSNGIYLTSLSKRSSDATKLELFFNSTADVSADTGSVAQTSIASVGTRVHFRLVYIYNDKLFALFINDGNGVGTTNAVQYNRQTFDIYVGAKPDGSQGLIGTIDELRIYDGTFLDSGNSTPPTLAEYQNITFSPDFERIISSYSLQSFDIERKVIHTVNFSCDFERVIDNSNIFSFDIIRKLIRTTNFSADIVRNLSHKLIITPAENGVFTDETNSTGVQSIEINLAAQQLTDRLSFTAINNAEIMQQVKGKYLDYNFDMRIEKIVERGVLKTCHCCSDIDELLFTQIAYKVTKVVGGVYVTDENKKVTMVEKPKASASSHIQKIAEILGKKTVLLFEDFISTVDIEQGGVTYNDLIRELFGWSARVPPRLINCYIRDDTLYVIQRGYEQNVIDLTDEHSTRPTVTRELIRTTWAATSATTKLTNRNSITKDWEPILGDTIPDSQPEPDPEPNPEPEPEQPKRVLPKQKVITENGITTTINYEYDEDGNVTKVTTTTDENMIIVEYKYEEIDGRKYLAQETTQEWVSTENGLELFDEKIIHHDYLTQGQRNSTGTDSDGEPFHSQTTPAPFDSRPTPFTERQSGGFSPSDFKPTKIEPSGERQKFFDKLKGYTYNENGDKVEVLGYKSSNKEVQGILLFDSSFPIDNNLSKSFLYRLTGEIERLNRRTQETVTFDLLGYPHVIDFNDRIILAGRTFFLVSNTVVKTPRIVNKQSLQLVRWY